MKTEFSSYLIQPKSIHDKFAVVGDIRESVNRP